MPQAARNASVATYRPPLSSRYTTGDVPDQVRDRPHVVLISSATVGPFSLDICIHPQRDRLSATVMRGCRAGDGGEVLVDHGAELSRLPRREVERGVEMGRQVRRPRGAGPAGS